MSACGSPDFVSTYHRLASISSKLDIPPRVNSKMAGHELGQPANSDALKWMPGRCARARSFSVGDQRPKSFQF